MVEQATVYVVDDDQAIREGVIDLVEEMGLKAYGYASAKAFLDVFTLEGPACLVLDVRMPQMNGMDLLAHLHEHHIGLPVIMMTGHGDIRMTVEAMRMGAVGFVEKPFREQYLWENIQEALAASSRMREGAERRSALLGKIESLSDKERDVVNMLITGKSDKEIAHDLNVSRRAIAFHRTSLLEKLDIGNVVELTSVLVRFNMTL